LKLEVDSKVFILVPYVWPYTSTWILHRHQSAYCSDMRGDAIICNPTAAAAYEIQVFGATGHMGRSLVKNALAANDLVCAVGRTSENTMASMQNWHSNCLGTLCDVRARETVAHVIQQTIAKFGRIDVIANCSGYGVIAACEDQDEHEIRNQFETNFMGALNIIQLSLPYFREAGAGRYLIFSSTSGALGVPGLGPYCATKYAVEGLIEAMLYEVDAFNIKDEPAANMGTLFDKGAKRAVRPSNQPGAACQKNGSVAGRSATYQRCEVCRTLLPACPLPVSSFEVSLWKTCTKWKEIETLRWITDLRIGCCLEVMLSRVFEIG
jgi:short-subunit dehydrogenase